MEQKCNKSMDKVHTSLERHLGMLYDIEPFCHYQKLPKNQNDVHQRKTDTATFFASSLELYDNAAAARRNHIAAVARRDEIAAAAAPIAANTLSSPGSTRYHQRQSPGWSPKESIARCGLVELVCECVQERG